MISQIVRPNNLLTNTTKNRTITARRMLLSFKRFLSPYTLKNKSVLDAFTSDLDAFDENEKRLRRF